MAHFHYKAIASNGKTVQGSIAADRIELASRELRGQGLTLVSLESGSGRMAVGEKSRSVGSDDILAMTRELAVLLRAGLPIDRALKVMIDMVAVERSQLLLEELLASVKAGKGLSQAMEPYRKDFGNFYINMIRSGEASGHMADVLTRLSDYLTNAKTVRSSVISALIYPCILLSVATLSIVGMLGFVVPQFETLFADMGDALPALTRGIIAAGDFVESYGWLMLVLSAIAVYLGRNWAGTEAGRGRLDQWLLQLPVLGPVVFKYEIAKFARTIGTLMGNGVALVQSISIAVDTVDNTQVKKALGVLEPAVKRGQRMSVALQETNSFTPMVVQIVRVGEESGSLDRMMTELADVYDEEVQAGVKRSLALLEPVLILVMGGTIALIIIAVLMGIMSINDLAL
ncbi:MAG: type II secretion system F family protein [Halieaceae bacterium]|jgi:general secretion pathway protein F|nr:type II secretion system F family protein [Halieaceae bacterium]